MVSDKGSDGLGSIWYLLYEKGTRAAFWPDPFHGPWRELDNAVSAGKKKHALLMSSIVHNGDFGPFEGCSFWEQQRESAREMVAKMGEGGPLLEWLWPKTLRDKGVEASEYGQKEFLQALLSSRWMVSKGARVCSTRWGTWAAEEAERLPSHHGRLLVLIHYGLVQGWFRRRGSLDAMINGLLPRRRPTSAGASTTKEAMSL